MLTRVPEAVIHEAFANRLAVILAEQDAANVAWAAIKVTVDDADTAGLGMNAGAVTALKAAIDAAVPLGTTASTTTTGSTGRLEVIDDANY